MTEQEANKMPDWPICVTDGCIGVRRDGQEDCLAHVGAQVRKAILAALKPGADIDLRGTPIDDELVGSDGWGMDDVLGGPGLRVKPLASRSES
jgi:hypothetical protein